MALTTSEVRRIKYELGYNILAVGAEPYVGVTQLFELVIAPYMTAGAVTTSATTVVAASAPTVVTLTLASVTGISVFDRLVVDVDAAQEFATVRSITGLTVSVMLMKAHTGTYPVTVEGGESIVREILRECIRIGGGGGLLSASASKAGLKKVDDIEFFGNTTSTTITAQQREELAQWRDDLASAIGCENLRRVRDASGGAIGLC